MGDAHTERPQRMKRREYVLAALQQQRLGDFKLKTMRRKAGAFERAHHRRQQIAGAELQRRQIDRDLDVGHCMASSQACRSTNAPIAPIRPVSSATAMKSPGGIMPGAATDARRIQSA
jgi:hypothetical protein